jgi:hypothetical protein
MYEELNLQDEHLVPTSHAKIRSYVCHQNLDAIQIKASLQHLQAIVEGRDVANLVLLLKELVPDYNPGTELLKTALSVKPYNTGPERIPVHREQTETPDVAKLKPAELLN